MRRHLVWLILLPIAICALWQLQSLEPVASPFGIGILLLTLGAIAGLRIATDSATRFVRDLTRLNQYLAEQNRDLAEMNHSLLKQVLQEADDLVDSIHADES